MTDFVSTATMRNDNGKLVYMRSKREASDTDTQARKAATRYWNGIADARDWELDTVYCVRRGSCGFVVSERRMDRRDWTRYLAPETPSPQVKICIDELGGEAPTQPPPETMAKIDDGGPAFPPHHNPETHASGMTLRDWFAGQALVAVLGLGLKSEQADEMGIASISYQVADAMLKERGSS